MRRKIVNVASVPQRSPFRYPGGKTWLVPLVRLWLRGLSFKPKRFIEPFVGGGIVSLTIAFENFADQVVMVEMDEDVAAVWKTITGGHAQWLADRITAFDLTVDSAKSELSIPSKTICEKAFRTILKNRVYHGGIMANGSSMIRNGENGKGITSRWYPNTLKKRILDIDEVKDKLCFIEGDGMLTMQEYIDHPEAVFFIDPPYTAAGKRAGTRLYKHNELDHEKLFEITAKLRGDFLMTYDHADGVVEMARQHGFDTELVAMKNTHHAEMTELLIGRNLDWIRVSDTQAKQRTFNFE